MTDGLGLSLSRQGALVIRDIDRLEIHVYLDRENNTQGIVYIDAGAGYGEHLLIRFLLRPESDGLNFSMASEGGFPCPYPSLEITRHGTRLTRALLDGRPVAFSGARVTIPSSGSHTVRFQD